MTYREIIYMCLDEIKAMSDDAYITEDHILFLVSKYRTFALRQKYDKTNLPVAFSNFQKHSFKYGAGTNVSRIMNIATPIVYVEDWNIEKGTYHEYYTYVPYHRFLFIGNNKYLKSIKYCTISPDGSFLMKPFEKFEDDDATRVVNIQAVFEDMRDIQDNLDTHCPIEDELVAGIIALVVKDILGVAYRPQDKANNASDELGSVGMLSGNPKNNK